MRLLAMLLVLACSTIFADESTDKSTDKSSRKSAAEIAVVIRTGGEVIKTSIESVESSLKRRDTLSEGDQISTGAGAYATLKFSDQSVIDMAEHSTLKVSEFEVDSTHQKPKILLELLSGQLRTITGNTAKAADAYELRTAHASIGIRGTEFEVNIVSETQTLVTWHEGVVLVRSLEFPEQIVELTEASQQASVTVGSPAQLVPAAATQTMGAFGAALLAQIAAIPAPLIMPPVPLALPAVVALDSDGATPTSSAENGEPMEAFVSYVRQQQWQPARVLADELSDRFEGLPRFDLYYGILLMAEQQYDEAIFSFERVLLFSPDQHRARLELGRAYYLTQNYQRATDALEQVLATKPPAEVKAKVEVLLTRVSEAQKRTQSRTYFGGGALIGWDTNYNAGSNLSNDDELDANLIGLTELASASKPKASLYSQFSISTGQVFPTSQNSTSQFNVDFTQRQYSEAGANNTQALTLGGVLNKQNDRWRSKVPASLQWSRLNNENWQATTQVNTQYQYRIWGPLWAGVNFGTQMAAALNSDNNSSVKDMAGVVFDVQERGRVHTFTSGYLQTSVAGEDDGHVEWRGISNKYQLAWSLPWKVHSNLTIEHQWRRYKDKDLLFTVNKVSTELKLRQDQLFIASLNAGWAPTHWLQTQTQVNWERVESNINAYGRDRLTVSQLLSIRF